MPRHTQPLSPLASLATLEDLAKLHGASAMVQVYLLKLGETTHTLLGPVTHLPELGIESGDVVALHFGEVIPVEAAIGFLGSQETGVWSRLGEH